MTMVSEAASVDPSAELGHDVEIGPFAVVGAGVRLADGVRVGPHCVVEGPAVIGAGCRLSSHVVVGSDPQDLKYDGERTEVVVGRRNHFREFVTVNRGTASGGGVTSIGDDNLFMTGSHVAHDCTVGSDTVFANNATLAGHVHVGDGARVGAFSAVHQFCRVGPEAFIGGFTVCTKDVLPYVKTVGSRGDVRTFGVNRIGLERRGLSSAAIDALQEAYRRLRRGNVDDALATIRSELADVPEVELLAAFVEESGQDRGFHR